MYDVRVRAVLFLIFIGVFCLFPVRSEAYTFCGYGETYDYFSDSCKCSYGYVRTYSGCITDDQYCKNKYGFAAQADYSGNCECSYGYVMSGGQCVMGSTYCFNKFGLHSTYDSLSEKCECSIGYLLNNAGNKCISADEKCQEDYGWNAESSSIVVNKFSSLECKCKSGYLWNSTKTACIEGNTRCHELFGYNSSYDSLSDSCDCDIGYLLSNNECISESDYCENILSPNSYYVGNGNCACNSGYIFIDYSNECKSEEDFCMEELGDNSHYVDDLQCECDDGYVLDSETNQCMEEELFCETYFGENMEYTGDNECECISGYHESENGCSKNFLSLPWNVSTNSNNGKALIAVVVLSVFVAIVATFIHNKPKV